MNKSPKSSKARSKNNSMSDRDALSDKKSYGQSQSGLRYSRYKIKVN